MIVVFEILKKILFNPKTIAFGSIFIINLIKKNMNEENKIEEEKIKNSHPLFLPRGTIRAILALSLVGLCGASFVLNFNLPDEVLALTILIVGYYFGYRSDNTQLPEIKK